MTATTRFVRARALDLLSVTGFALAGAAVGGLDTAILGAVLGFFVAKTVDSVRRAVA